MNIKIAPNLKTLNTDICLGVLTYPIEIAESNDLIKAYMQETMDNFANQYKLDDLNENLDIVAAREIYKALNKKKRDYTIASEAIAKRVLKGKRLGSVNNLVDIQNSVCLEQLLSIGSYDYDKLVGNITFEIAMGSAQYLGISNKHVHVGGTPTFKDEIKYFGCPISDSKETMVNSDTMKVISMIISFSGTRQLQKAMNLFHSKLINLANVKEENMKIFIVE